MMSLRLSAAGAIALLALQPVAAPAASIEAGGQDIAIAACASPDLGASWLVHAAEDGIGGYAVWLVDGSRQVWLCNADATGAVFANVPMAGDLLNVDVSGLGATYVPALAEMPLPAIPGETPIPRPNPIRLAEAACRVMAVEATDAALAAIADDGLGAYLVWFHADDGALWLCDASGAGAVYAYESIPNRPLAEAGV